MVAQDLSIWLPAQFIVEETRILQEFSDNDIKKLPEANGWKSGMGSQFGNMSCEQEYFRILT